MVHNPYEFGVRIVPLYPPVCRKRQLKGGVRRSLVVTFAAIRLRGLRFKPHPQQKFETRFLLHAHPMLRLWDHNIELPEPVPKLETHHQQVEGRSNGADTSITKKKHE